MGPPPTSSSIPFGGETLAASSSSTAAPAAPEARTPKSLLRGAASLPGGAGASLTRTSAAVAYNSNYGGYEEKEPSSARDDIRGFAQLPSSAADNEGGSGSGASVAPATAAPPLVPPLSMNIPPPISFSSSGNRRRGSSGSSASSDAWAGSGSNSSAPSTPRSSHDGAGGAGSSGGSGHTPDNSGHGATLPRPSTPRSSGPPPMPSIASEGEVGASSSVSPGTTLSSFPHARAQEHEAEPGASSYADNEDYYGQQQEQVGLHLTPERPLLPGRSSGGAFKSPVPVHSSPAVTSTRTFSSSRPGSDKKSPAGGSAPPRPTSLSGGGGGPPPVGSPPLAPPAPSSSSGETAVNPYSNRSLQSTHAAHTAAPPMMKIHTFDPSKAKALSGKRSPSAGDAGAASASSGGNETKTNESDAADAAELSAADAVAEYAPATASGDDFPDPFASEQMQMQNAPSPDSVRFMGGSAMPLTKVASFSAPPVHRPVYAPTPMPHDPPESKDDGAGGGGMGDVDSKADKLAQARKAVRSREREAQRMAAIGSVPKQGYLVQFLRLINFLMTLGIAATVIGLLALVVALHPPQEQEISLVHGATGTYDAAMGVLHSILELLPQSPF